METVSVVYGQLFASLFDDIEYGIMVDWIDARRICATSLFICIINIIFNRIQLEHYN